MTVFRPGKPLPGDPTGTSERTIYHAQRKNGEWATMTREGGTWQWRQLHGQADDEYGSGGWSDLQKWLAK
ncbi:hypothetical protein [Deinococcus navajonensis]|uniref:Uncharacterized protein n=1 Tax=Deinococcus navajonensis TaxID=309884 RepID=A0ABV8XGX5_9DEIO